jgi:prevent-host-death family protein
MSVVASVAAHLCFVHVFRKTRKMKTGSTDEVVKVTASEFQRAFGELSDKALKEAVAITKQGRDHLVLVSAEEYARLKRRDRKVGRASELSDEWLEAVRKAEVPRRARRGRSLK